MPWKSHKITLISITENREGGRTVDSGRVATIIDALFKLFISEHNIDNMTFAKLRSVYKYNTVKILKIETMSRGEFFMKRVILLMRGIISGWIANTSFKSVLYSLEWFG